LERNKQKYILHIALLDRFTTFYISNESVLCIFKRKCSK